MTIPKNVATYCQAMDVSIANITDVFEDDSREFLLHMLRVLSKKIKLLKQTNGKLRFLEERAASLRDELEYSILFLQQCVEYEPEPDGVECDHGYWDARDEERLNNAVDQQREQRAAVSSEGEVPGAGTKDEEHLQRVSSLSTEYIQETLPILQAQFDEVHALTWDSTTEEDLQSRQAKLKDLGRQMMVMKAELQSREASSSAPSPDAPSDPACADEVADEVSEAWKRERALSEPATATPVSPLRDNGLVALRDLVALVATLVGNGLLDSDPLAEDGAADDDSLSPADTLNYLRGILDKLKARAVRMESDLAESGGSEDSGTVPWQTAEELGDLQKRIVDLEAEIASRAGEQEWAVLPDNAVDVLMCEVCGRVTALESLRAGAKPRLVGYLKRKCRGCGKRGLHPLIKVDPNCLFTYQCEECASIVKASLDVSEGIRVHCVPCGENRVYRRSVDASVDYRARTTEDLQVMVEQKEKGMRKAQDVLYANEGRSSTMDQSLAAVAEVDRLRKQVKAIKAELEGRENG